MGISLAREGTAFLYSVLLGGILGVLYDAVRILRVFFGVSAYSLGARRLSEISFPLIGPLLPRHSPNKKRIWALLLLGVGDVLFALLAAVLFSVFLYVAASGYFRWFYLFGCGIGFFGYYFTVGKLVILSSETIVFLFRVFLRYILWIFLVPLRFLRWCTGLFLLHCVQPVLRKIRYRMALQYTRRVRSRLWRLIRFSDFL